MDGQENRRKVEKKTPPPIAPKKREEQKEKPIKNKIETVTHPELFSEPTIEPPKPTVKYYEEKYVKIKSDATKEEFRAIGERVQKGELKWSHYCSDGPVGAHYYAEVKK
jgi:hypothetical protein